MNTSEYMLEAITLAKKGEFSVQPNPMVGCVITKGKQIIGRGWHKKYGSHHAEVNAIRNCLLTHGIVKGKKLLKGSTMFVTLEPCSITNNTPPCTNLIVRYEIAKVVYGAKDPNPKIFGNGLKQLRSKGINVELSSFKAQSQDLLKIFKVNQIQKRPFITLKIALSKDGFLAPKNAVQQYMVSSKKSRINVQTLRKKHRAILIGGETLRIDRPSLHIKNQKTLDRDQPIKIVLTNKDITHADFTNLTKRYSKIVLISTKEISLPTKNNIEAIVIPARGKRFLNELMKELLARNISSVLVESGQKIFKLFQENNFIDELIIYRSNQLLEDGLMPLSSYQNFENFLNRLTLLSSEKIGPDIKSTYKI